MAYFIFTKDLDNITGSIYRIAENESDLNNMNIEKNVYKIIEDTDSNFELVKLGKKFPEKYVNNSITYISNEFKFNLENLKNYIEEYKKNIFQFLNNNRNHVLFNRWNDYYNQLNTLNLENITYPLNVSLEQYFKDQNLTSLNPLQIP
jgi:hypothetical protein